MTLAEKIQQLPSTPGVYQMLDASGEVIYVGKAVNLRQRVRSYFNQSGDSRYQVRFLLPRIADIQIVVTDTEKEALLLENTLIKQFHPRYNLNLKDDKTYFSLRIDTKEAFPRFTVVRKRPDDSARYFGPYSSGHAAKEVMRQMTRMFPLRHYPLATCLSRSRPCLYHQIGQCSAPCHKLISAEDYAVLVEGAVLFLDGKGRQLVAEFRRRMNDAADVMNYEEAAHWRNLLRCIEVTVEKQKVVLKGGDIDVVGYYRNESSIDIALMSIRGGVLTGSRLFSVKWEFEDAAAIAAFLQQYYTDGVGVPAEILLPLEVEERSVLAGLLREIKRINVALEVPVRGTKRDLVQMANKNAMAAYKERREKKENSDSVLQELCKQLKLSRKPNRIECYDISTIQGSFSVGSGVVFTDGVSDKPQYRHYKIRDVAGQDDFSMLREVFQRRFSAERVSKAIMPDLIVVDGGIGQLNAVQEIVSELGLNGSFDLVSLAKSRVESDVESSSVQKSDERVFLPGRKNPVVLKQNSPPLLLLAAIRNEAHRFAITYHRKLRSKNGLASALQQIDGIGAQRRTALLKKFGSLKNIKNATVTELMSVNGISRSIAEAVVAGLNK